MFIKIKNIPFVVSVGLLLLLPATARAQKLKLECESYTSSSNVCGKPIMSGEVGGCSGGYALIGLDCAGDRTEYFMALDTLGYYEAAVLCKGTAGIRTTLRLTFFPLIPGHSQSVNVSFVGNGLEG